MVLSYPVISARPEAHPEWHDSFSALLGPDRTPEEEAFSPWKNRSMKKRCRPSAGILWMTTVSA